MDEVEEIKNKLDIVEVIREYIPVKAVGANFQALCPFHHEKTPSFIISPDKQIWHCFGCDRGGDVFAFVMEKEGLSFGETLRLLAPKAGVTLKAYRRGDYSRRNRILDIMDLAGKYYSHFLNSPAGQNALSYLLSRGLNQDTIKDWRLGASPDTWDALYKFLKTRPKSGKQYTDEEISGAGLSLAKKTPGTTRAGYFDRFRSRIMFPICDPNGNIIAFTARVKPENEAKEKMGKYINSPQTTIYDKSKVLFGLHQAKTAIRQEDLAIVVEGQVDVLACYQHGFKNVVASSGTALTAEQVALIKRFTNKVALLFDMDKAGQLAADRGIKEVLRQGMNPKIIILKGYKDPDECLNSNPADFQKALDEAKPMLEYYFTKTTAGLDLDNLDNKMIIQNKMFMMIDLVPSKTEQGYWLKKISEELNFSEIDVREEFLKWRRKSGVLNREETETKEESPVKAVKESTREEKLAEACLALLIKFPELVNYSISNLEPADLPNDIFANFYKNLIIYYNKSADSDYADFSDYLTKESQDSAKLLEKLILLGEKDFYNYEDDRAHQELISIIGELKRYSKQKKIKDLQQAIATAEAAGRRGELAALMEELKNLTIS